MSKRTFLHLRVSGSPYECGRQYGQQAAALIRANLNAYSAYFDALTAWDWDQAKSYAQSFETVIQAYRSHFIDEMQGIADGAQAEGFAVTYADILALNLRTEIRNKAIACASPLECTAFAILPGRSAHGHTLIGQNWDWITAVAETVVVLEVESETRPNFVTVVEAGLLAKAGMNAAGIGLTTNALHSDLERQAGPGVPYHAILRSILEASNLSQAIEAITAFQRGSSANYLIAHQEGVAFNAETAPGDFSRAYIHFIEEQVYAHTNHYLSPTINFKDLAPWHGPGSLVRQHRLDRFLKDHQDRFSIQDLQETLQDHFNFPEAICTHPQPADPEIDQFMTVASLIMDLDEKIMYLAAGNPCQNDYKRLEYAGFLR
jgi:isopenicillin-N N-acyltransferase-like protein